MPITYWPHDLWHCYQYCGFVYTVEEFKTEITMLPVLVEAYKKSIWSLKQKQKQKDQFTQWHEQRIPFPFPPNPYCSHYILWVWLLKLSSTTSFEMATIPLNGHAKHRHSNSHWGSIIWDHAEGLYGHCKPLMSPEICLRSVCNIAIAASPVRVQWFQSLVERRFANSPLHGMQRSASGGGLSATGRTWNRNRKAVSGSLKYHWISGRCYFSYSSKDIKPK